MEYYVRRRPVTADNPTKAQKINRLRFSMASYNQFGRKGYAKDGTPIVAANVSREMRELPPIRQTDDEIQATLNRELERAVARLNVPWLDISNKVIEKISKTKISPDLYRD